LLRVVGLKVVVAVLAVAGLLPLRAHRRCRVLLRFLVARLRLLLRDKAEEGRAVLQQELAPEVLRQWI